MNVLGESNLRVGITAPMQKLDPRGTADFVNYFVQKQVFETTFFAPTGGRVPRPALFSEPLKTETVAGAPMAFSAQVRDDIKFSDGTPMTPQHVYDSIRTHAVLRGRATVELDGDRLLFSLSRPDAGFSYVLSNPALVVYHLSGGGVVGTGPYRYVAGSKPGTDTLRLELNPHFREQAAIPGVELVVYPREADGTPKMLMEALGEGNIDLTFALSKAEAEALKVPTIRKRVEPGDSTAVLWFNVERPWLKDRNVRQALSLAVDRNALARHFYSATLTFSASGLLPPALGTMPDMLFHSLDKAKKVLEEAGGAQTRPLKMLLIPRARPYLPNPGKAAELVTAQLGEIGITVDVKPTTSVDDYSAKTAGGDYDLVLAGFIADTPYPADFLDSILGSWAVPEKEGDILTRTNLSRWRSEEMDAALEKYRAMPSNDARKREIVRLLREELPFVPLMYGPTVTVHTSRVFGISQEFQAYPSFAMLELKGV